jgi:hypothetical protein
MEQQTKTFLDEGFDFIEESYSEIPLEFTETSKDIIVEAKGGSPSPYHILGVCRGVFQPVNEPSRNGRIYDSDHWQYQINKPELQERLQNRQMLGQIGHRNERVNDFVLSAGEVSHVVTKMEIREGSDGKPYLYGELEILDTPAGRILKALYEGGVGLYISSRGAGKLETIPGQTMKRVSKTSFFLETWDIVKAPGYLKAKPVYESSPTHESITEENINELNDKTIESDLDKRQGQMYDAQANAKANPEAAAEATKKYEHALDLAQKEAERNDRILDQDEKGNHKHYKNESEEIAELNNKINQLTKIIEKVVDDVYEEEGIVEAKDAEGNEHEIIKSENKNSEHPYRLEHKVNGKTVSVSTNDFPADVKKEEEHIKNSYGIKEALPEFISLMADSNITEEVFEEILDMIKGDLK